MSFQHIEVKERRETSKGEVGGKTGEWSCSEIKESLKLDGGCGQLFPLLQSYLVK